MPTICASRVINAPVADVWAVIRDFGSHKCWIEHHPDITLTNGTGLTVGVRRRVTYTDGNYFDEVLTGLDDRRWLQEYDVVGDLPMPVYNVIGAMQLYPITSINATFVERRLTYDTTLSEIEAEEFAKTRFDLLTASLETLENLFPS